MLRYIAKYTMNKDSIGVNIDYLLSFFIILSLWCPVGQKTGEVKLLLHWNFWQQSISRLLQNGSVQKATVSRRFMAT